MITEWLPAGQAAPGANSGTVRVLPIARVAQERWLRVELRAERLDWLPRVLASLDRPFVIERPDELRGLVIALADRLTASARRSPPHA